MVANDATSSPPEINEGRGGLTTATTRPCRATSMVSPAATRERRSENPLLAAVAEIVDELPTTPTLSDKSDFWPMAKCLMLSERLHQFDPIPERVVGVDALVALQGLVVTHWHARCP